jgi:hypothetical protein
MVLDLTGNQYVCKIILLLRSPSKFDFYLASFTLTITTLRPTNVTCSIPYCLGDTGNVQYYCSFVSFRKDLICGVSSCPNITNQSSFGKCDFGYYIMITSDKFENAIGSFRSRLYSPVYNRAKDFCIRFQYNIYSQSDDGFRVYLEDYINPDDLNLIHTIIGPLPINKWYTALIEIKESVFNQFRVGCLIFKPFIFIHKLNNQCFFR